MVKIEMINLNLIITACAVAVSFGAPAAAQQARTPNTIRCIFREQASLGVNFNIRFEVEILDKTHGQEVDTFSSDVWTPVNVSKTLYEYVIWDNKGAGDRGPFKLTINRETRKAKLFLPGAKEGYQNHEGGDCGPPQM